MPRVHVIGMGEVGRRLARALASAEWDVAPVTRDEGWNGAADPGDPSPRIVAVREEDLGVVLDRLAAVPRSRIVPVQNGFLEAVHGDLGPVTRGLIWFTSKGEFFRALRPSLLHGPLARELAEALGRGGIETEEIGGEVAFRREMIVKGIWNCVVGLPLAVHGVDLAAYLREFGEELLALVDEGAEAAGAEYGVAVDPAATVDAIRATTADLGWVRGGAKALAWRNAAVAAFGRRHGVPTPVHDRLLRAADHEPGPP